MDRVETKHLTKRECKIVAMKLLAAEWLATGESALGNGYQKDEYTTINYDESTCNWVMSELEKLNDELLTRAAKLEYPTIKTKLLNVEIELKCVKFDIFQITLKKGKEIIKVKEFNDFKVAKSVYDEILNKTV